MNALPLRPQQAAQLAQYRLKVSLDGVLSEAQSKVWQGLVSAKGERKAYRYRRSTESRHQEGSRG